MLTDGFSHINCPIVLQYTEPISHLWRLCDLVFFMKFVTDPTWNLRFHGPGGLVVFHCHFVLRVGSSPRSPGGTSRGNTKSEALMTHVFESFLNVHRVIITKFESYTRHTHKMLLLLSLRNHSHNGLSFLRCCHPTSRPTTEIRSSATPPTSKGRSHDPPFAGGASLAGRHVEV